jgi:fructose-bisphosphate aldolase, class II
MLSNLKKEIAAASNHTGVVVGFNVFGFEDANAVLKAAELLNYPVALMLNKLAIQTLPIESWAGLLLPLAERAKVPVSVHLDHCKDFNTILRAIHYGFTSVMFDGSQLPVDENIRLTKEVVKVASCFNVSVEGEIGSVR